MFGKSNVETAPYQTIESDSQQEIELRYYEKLVLVSAPMASMDSDKNSAFSKLFDYISGKNTASSEIDMTAPVLVDETERDAGVEISMTAPVFMDDTGGQASMSFVLPATYTLNTAPVPQDPSLTLNELKDYTVAAIRFSGLLSDENIDEHRAILEAWIEDNGYTIAGAYKAAGYNPPFTIPALRRNEVLIPVEPK